MRVPLCICNGVIRSGSTWSFNVCRGLMQEHSRQLGQPCGSSYLEESQLETFINRVWENAPGPTVIKAHRIGPTALNAIRSGQVRAVCTFRDPRDCVASDVVFLTQGLDASVRRVAMTLEYLRHYQMNDYMMLLRYENMMADRRREIRRIAEHLGIHADDEMVSRVDSRTNLDAAKKLCSELRFRPSANVLHVASHRVDPETHLHENHISSSKIGRWKTDLTVEQGRVLTEYFSSSLLALGYETQQSLNAIVSATGSSQSAVQSTATYAPGIR